MQNQPQTLRVGGSGISAVLLIEVACGVMGGVPDPLSAPLSASENVSASCSVSEVSRSDPRPCSSLDTAVRNVSMELDREAVCVWPSGVDGMRKDDGAVGLRVVAVAVIGSEPNNGTTGRWLTGVALSSGDSGTGLSSDAVASVTIAVTVVVSTVGDDGAWGGTVLTGWSSSCSFLSSEGLSSDADAPSPRIVV